MKVFSVKTPRTLLILNAMCGVLAFVIFLSAVFLGVRHYDDVFRASYSDYVIQLKEKAERTEDLQWLRLNLVESLKSEAKHSETIAEVTMLLLGFGFLYLVLCAENILFFWRNKNSASREAH
ncbi:MAG: hypothetical protein L0Y67_02820 [Gammaproteobacteria bacterium]|nr:hypothetical protein [Gammaproteobacteria bacterium]MCI0590528.1 hypothetical protein [Gammaproteobacteria bacterium]